MGEIPAFAGLPPETHHRNEESKTVSVRLPLHSLFLPNSVIFMGPNLADLNAVM